MAMTTKTIKTILFASLIAAMILPFSMGDFAVADKGDKQKDKIDKIKKSAIDFEEKAKKSQDKNEKEKHQKTAQLLKEVASFEDLKYKGLGNTELAKAKLDLIEKMIDEQHERVQAVKVDENQLPDPVSAEIEENIIPLAFASSYRQDDYTTSLQFTQSCGSTVTGQTDGWLRQYSLDSYILMNSDYPSSLHCNYSYKDTTVEYVKIGLSGICSYITR